MTAVSWEVGERVESTRLPNLACVPEWLVGPAAKKRNVEAAAGLVGVWCGEISFRHAQSEALPGRTSNMPFGQDIKVGGRNINLVTISIGEKP